MNVNLWFNLCMVIMAMSNMSAWVVLEVNCCEMLLFLQLNLKAQLYDIPTSLVRL